MNDERLTLDEGTVGVQHSAIRHSDKIDKIVPALVAAQKAIDHVGKGATAHIETKEGKPDYDYSYSTLAQVIDAIKKPLNDNDCIYLHGVSAEEFEYPYFDKTRLGMKVLVSAGIYHVSGQWFECDLLMVAADTTARTVGSSITYGRRYTVTAITGVASADDDAAASIALPDKDTKPRKQAPPDPPAADRAKSIREFGKEWDKTISEVEDGDEADVRRNLEHYFIYVKAGDRAMTFDPKHDYMRPLKAEAIDTLTGILKTKRAEVVGWLETDDVREAVGLPKLSIETCAGCAAILTPAEKEKSAMVKLPKGYCETCRPDAMVAMTAKKKEA
uniref:Putative Erf family protein n=1 Tax=viral metagenome TaxID=1070528 RepID=A0A6M3KMH7_9ZZZZ